MHPKVPQGWTSRSAVALHLTSREPGAADRRNSRNCPTAPRKAAIRCSALLTAEGRDYSEGYSLVARPDIGGFFYLPAGAAAGQRGECKSSAGLKIGYIMGAGDDIPTVLRQLGSTSRCSRPTMSTQGDLSRFGTIVLGIRAYDTREDVKKNNQRLLDYVNNGGTLLVQYNTDPTEFNAGPLTRRIPPQLSRDRVTVEAGAGHDSRSAEPRLPLSQPDCASPTSMAGCRSAASTSWIKWDDHSTRRCWPRNDPGEQPQKGGLLVAQYGKGYYIYTGYAFFRQLPFGVPGAIRLYVNLLSVGHEPR